MDRKPASNDPPNNAAPIVVIVDSDESFGVLLQYDLERRGYHVLRLSDARYALRLLRDMGADLLITTLDSDEMDNVELLVGLSAEPQRPPVLLCSRHPSTSPAMVAAAETLGVSLVLPRPCRFEVIAGAVKTLLAAEPLAAEPLAAESALALRSAS